MKSFRPVALARRGVFVSGLLAAAAGGLVASGAAAEKKEALGFSALWGERGEKWRADGRLPDFSRAGYHEGEAAIQT